MSVESMWSALSEFSETYTCYSAAVAAWVAHEREDWPSLVNPGLALSVVPAEGRLFGFAHFPPTLRRELGLERVGLDGTGEEALEKVLAEVGRSGRAIVAGDGFRLPWHVAHGKRHVPHWYVLSGAAGQLEAIDPFACRNDLGVQQATRIEIAREDLAEMLLGLPGDDPVLALRERLALGDDCPAPVGGCQWFVRADVAETLAPVGAEGPDGVLVLARGFREHGQEPGSYTQADDIWSIARHRAFLVRHASAVAAQTGDGELEAWVGEHGEPLVKRWGHMAPLLMQATLTLAAGRPASASVPDALEELAGREQAASQAFPSTLDVGSI
jgi:hypothetical protein